MSKIALVITFFFLITSCQKEETWSGPEIPSHFPEIAQKNMQNRKFTKAGFLLGKRLFFDPILSVDSTISCGSCHQQAGAFSHIDHDLSHGVMDRLGKRNAPAIQNLLWNNSFFWDGGVQHIDLISLAPIENDIEMDETIQNVVLKLNRNPYYKQAFKNVYQIDDIKTMDIMAAITEFQAMLVSSKSPYDQFLKGSYTLSSIEQEGKKLFEDKCATCHSGVLQSDFMFRNNGIQLDNHLDKGRFEITLNPEDEGKFKTPSLRNIAITPPYMHNGSINTLEAVLEHYNSGIKQNPALDPKLKNGIPMHKEEQKAIIAFLKTLTDQNFVNDARFGF
jgi:cytochrome c peroxidase